MTGLRARAGKRIIALMNRLSLLLVPTALFAASSAVRADLYPGLEDFGSLTLVDEIDCATDTTHRFRDYPRGASYVTNVLGRATRVLHHRNDKGAYVSWRVGEGKGIVPNEPYVLVVDYPDDAPRSVTLMNFGNGTRHGWHTGFTVGDSMSPPYVTQSLESWPVPLSGEWRQVVEVMVPYKRATQYDGGERIDVATEGFDVDFALILQNEAKDSVGLAVQSVRLYRIDSYDVARPTIPYPADGLPRRLVTSREEMGDGDNHEGYSDNPREFYKGRAKMIRLLGMNGCSKDLLEFGYLQNWNTYGRDWKWGQAPDYWTKAVEYLGEEDIDILPFYEYHGSRGSGGIGYNQSLMPWTLQASKYPDRKFYFSHQLHYIANCMADMTNDETLWDLEELFRLTVLNLSDKAHFRGMWLRNRGGMPMGFNDHAISRFNADTGRTNAGTEVTRADIYNDGNYRGTALYEEYRAWWYEKRRDLLATLRAYMASNLDGAVLYYSNTGEEPGEFWANWNNPHPAVESSDPDCMFQGKTFNQYTGLNWSSDLFAAASGYWPNALNADSPTWGNYEIHHDGPADDPHNYTNLTGVALCYPFNTVWTVADKTAAARYRTAGDDLPFVRHYSLNENDLVDGANPPNGNKICGYYTCDWDRAGRAVMLSELYAMAYSDPTMLGYLFGSNLGRTDSLFVREFNLNYLSLPALRSEVLVGGAWPATFTVRRWTTAQGTYWAAINCDKRPWSGTVDFRTSAQNVWRTVGNSRVDLSDGTAALSLEPFQMVCFTDVEPPAVETPVFRYAAAANVEARKATLVANLSSLGEGSSSATVRWSISGGPADPESGTFPVFQTHGEQRVTVSGLDAETDYTVTLVATGSNGESATMDFSFRTAVWPFVLQTPSAVTDGLGTTATATVKFARANVAGALSLVVDDAVVETWNDVAVGTAYSASFPVEMGRVKKYRFVVVDPEDLYETHIDGAVLGRKTIGWIDVAFGRAAYDAWPFASAAGVDPADGGTWTLAGAENESVLGTGSDGSRRIDMATGTDGFVRYAASSASPDGAKVRVEGRTELVAEYGVPPDPESPPLAALALGKEGMDVQLYGYAGSGWVALSGLKVSSPFVLDWAVEYDPVAGTVAYRAGDPEVALVSAETGEAALSVAASRQTSTVSRVTFVGNGTVGDFRGFRYVEEPASGVRLLSLDGQLRPGPEGVSFRNAGTDTETFVIELEGVLPGLWYAVFATDELTADPTAWSCVASARAGDGAGTLALPASTAGFPSRFFKVFSADSEVPAGTLLSALSGDD